MSDPLDNSQSSALPEKLQVVFPARRCAGNPGDQGYPRAYASEVTAADAGFPDVDGSPGTLTVRSTALALYSAPDADPSNKETLDALAVQLATDLYSWRSVAFDKSWAGIIAPEANGLYDEIVWRYDGDHLDTRARSGPRNGEPQEYQHLDPAVGDCNDGQTDPNDPTTAFVVAKTPLLEMYGPASGSGAFTRKLIGIEDGRLVESLNGSDAPPCAAPCTENQGFLVFVFGCPSSNPPSIVTGVTLNLLDSGGHEVATTNTPIYGSFPNPYFFLHAPSAGIYTITGTVPGYTLIPRHVSATQCQGCFVSFVTTSFTAVGCGAFEGYLNMTLAGAQVTFDTPIGPFVQTTDANGFTCFPVLVGVTACPGAEDGPYGYSVDAGPRLQVLSVPDSFTIPAAETAQLQLASGYSCVPRCAQPLNNTLHATTPFGDVTLTYDPSWGGSIPTNRSEGVFAQGGIWTARLNYTFGATAHCPGATCGLYFAVVFGVDFLSGNKTATLYVWVPFDGILLDPPVLCPITDLASPTTYPVAITASLSGNECPETGAVNLSGVLVSALDGGQGGGPVVVTE